MAGAFQFGDLCTSSAKDSLQSVADGVTGQVVDYAGTPHVVTVSPSRTSPSGGFDALQYKFTPVSGSAVTKVVAIPVPMCTKLTYDDTFPIVLAIFIGWISIAAVKWLMRVKSDA